MAYTKPQLIAQNASSGSYAASCPENTRGHDTNCKDGRGIGCTNCERTK